MPGPNSKHWNFITLLVLVSIAFVCVLLPFYGALLWAVILALLFEPLQRRLVAAFAGRRNLAAALSVLACVCIVVIPGSLLLGVLAHDANNLYQRLDDRQLDPTALIARVHGSLPEPIARLLGSVDALEQRLTALATEGSRAVASHLVSFGQGTARFFVSLGVMLYVLFFFFRDGTQLVATIRRASPLDDRQTGYLMEKFTLVVKATIKGNFITAFMQGALGGIAFWALGIDGALLWGVVMAVLSLLPVIGGALVWAPMAAYLLITGEVVRGIVLLAVGTLVISTIDNFLRPVLVGKDIQLPDYLVLVSTLGGLALLGMNGFVIGPLVAALFVAVWSLREDNQRAAVASPP